MIYLEDGSVVPVDKSELPVELPEDVDLNSKGIPLHIIQNGKIPFRNLLERKLLERLTL